MSLQDCAPPPGRGSSPSARGRWTEEAEVATDRTRSAAASEKETPPSAATWTELEDSMPR